MSRLYDKIPPELPSWVNSNSEWGDVIVGVQADCIRNLAGERFPCSMSEDGFSVISKKIKFAFENVVVYTGYIEVDTLSIAEREYLAERWLIDQYSSRHPRSSLLYIFDTENQTVLVNGRDHIKFQFWDVRPIDAIENIKIVRDSISQYLEWSYHEHWGYLSSDPQLSGSGTTFSSFCHLPAIVMSHSIVDFAKELLKSSVIVQPVWDAMPYRTVPMFRISVICRGDEVEFAEKFTEILDMVVAREREAREKLINTDGELLQDKVSKAQGVLMYAKLLEHWELVSLASTIRFGVRAGLVEGDGEAIDALLLVSGNRNIEAYSGTKFDQRDAARMRANFAREKLGLQ